MRDINFAQVRLAEIAGDDIAEEWKSGLYETLALVAVMPRSHSLVQESSRFRQEVRQFIYRRRPGTVAYRVLFTIREQTRDDPPTVFVVHVRHGAARPITRAEARQIEASE